MAHQGQGPASAAMARSMSPDWSSGLPPELLESVRVHLASGTDAASFRSVCTPWRDAVPFAPCFAPLLLLPSGGAPGAAAVTLYSVAEDKAFSVPLPDGVGKVPCGSSCGWLALMDEVASVTLFNPFTTGVVKLPPPDEEIALSSSTFVFKKDGRWMFHPDEDEKYVNAAAAADDVDVVTLDELRQVFFQEIVLSSPPDAGGCVAMAVLRSSTEVAFCRVGVDTAWTLVETNLECSVDSIVFCQGRFVAIDCTGEISIFSDDIATLPAGTPPTATPMPSLTPPVGLCHRSYVESNGELYVVGAMVNVFRWAQKFDYNTVVYKCSNILDQEAAWSRLNDAGDLTLFVSMDFRYGFAGTSVSGLKRNGVYFSEPLYGDQYDLAHSMEIADIATGISEVKTFHPKMQGLGWFRPNLWRGGERTSNDNNENPHQEAGPVPPEAQPESS